jgi:hypothetical protein
MSLYDKDFTFFVNNKSFACPIFVAELISVSVSSLRRSDASVTSFECEVENISDSELESVLHSLELLELPERLTAGNPMFDVLLALCNPAAIDLQAIGDLTVENVVAICKVKKQKGNVRFEAEVEFMAEHFEQLKADLPPDLIPYVLDSRHLRLWDEDSLYKFVIGQMLNDLSNVALLRSVKCNYLSQDCFDEYLALVDGFLQRDGEWISTFWPNLRKALARATTLPQPFRSRYLVMPCPAKPQSKFSGIIACIKQRFGQDPCEAGVLAITACSTDPEVYGASVNGGSPESVINYKSRLGWYDKNRSPSWLQFDFKDSKVCLSSYEINFGQSSSHYRQKWLLQGSNDGNNWTVIDDRSEETGVHKSWDIARFTCSGSREDFRFVRLWLTEPSWGAGHCLGLAAIEFYGLLKLAPNF